MNTQGLICRTPAVSFDPAACDRFVSAVVQDIDGADEGVLIREVTGSPLVH
ncbi:hypothetical protein ACFRMN_34305 [Streptomyces sp. NPDC056835]|uniref:hypothetical protein n=1 Tax=Streptomyces sp. NPDC056835 TaxID=3345956 RepID=UPI003694F6B5